MTTNSYPSGYLRTTILSLVWLLCLISASAQKTWFVRPDGGTRYSAGQPEGQCDGLADAPYPGSGKHQHCAFNDYRLLFQDGTYSNWAWVIGGGDTVILRGSIGSRNSYRVGWSNPESCTDKQLGAFRGQCGNPYAAAPPLPSGTPEHPTRLLGEHFASCGDPRLRTQLHGGYGTSVVIDMSGASWVDVECLDITDFSGCGRSGQQHGCSSDVGKLDDYASNGISWSNTSTHDTVSNVRIHGMASAGMTGAPGDAVVFRNIDLVGNASSGWNADSGNGKTGYGTLLVDGFNISWNGCAEQYPIHDALPYADCTDDSSSGYGDGFGTASVDSHPGWQVTFRHGIASYNTQDGLDALHITGEGSSMTVEDTQAYGNMGQQLKVGGAHGSMIGNRIVTNCNALREAIPGTPPGYNKRLSDFCRAADEGLLLSVNNGSESVFMNNIVLSASATAMDVQVSKVCDNDTCRIRQQHNIFVGFRNDRAHGYPNGSGELSNPVYTTDSARAYRSPGSSFDGNITWHASDNWPCPNTGLHETHAHCGDPHLTDESWHAYGIGDMTPTAATSFAPLSAAAATPSPRSRSRIVKRLMSAEAEGHRRAKVLGSLVLCGAGALLLRGGRRRGV